MPKSKSQAQKNEERQQRQQEQEQKRAEEKRIRDIELQKNRQIPPENDKPTVLNRKELRKLKKAQDSLGSTESKISEEEKISSEDNLQIKQIEREEDSLNFAAEDEASLESPAEIQNPAAKVNVENTLKKTNNTQPSSSLTPPPTPKPNSPATKEGDKHIEHSFKLIMKKTLSVAAEQIEKETSEISAKGQNARLVQNHSTHCEGLKPVLLRLAKQITGCTITPGRLSTVQSKSDFFVLEFQRATDKHTYQLVARNGHTAQDVLISVSNPEIYSEEVIREKIAAAQERKLPERDKPDHDDEVCSSQLNRAVHNARQSFWRDEHQEKDAYQKAKSKEAQHQMRLKEQERKLAGKDIPSGAKADIAARDVDIISGEKRTKNSMK